MFKKLFLIIALLSGGIPSVMADQGVVMHFIKNNGKVNMASGKTFDAPEGAVVEIPYGSIN